MRSAEGSSLAKMYEVLAVTEAYAAHFPGNW
jgi:hypothetical protein